MGWTFEPELPDEFLGPPTQKLGRGEALKKYYTTNRKAWLVRSGRKQAEEKSLDSRLQKRWQVREGTGAQTRLGKKGRDWRG